LSSVRGCNLVTSSLAYKYRLGWRWLTVANTSFYETTTITAVKNVIEAPAVAAEKLVREKLVLPQASDEEKSFKLWHQDVLPCGLEGEWLWCL